jgi:2-polyprenyl-3-methyl-5-hydroxy-6-metoxy-1,4-benzoquinol methylase
MTLGSCRLCGAELQHVFADLGMSPLSNSFPTKAELGKMEPFYPLTAFVCDRCFLVQLGEFASPEELFGDYAYFSSYSTTWLEHARSYVDMIVKRLELGPSSNVIEVASNDGYLLQYFVARGIPVLGVEPAANVARTAVERGVPTRVAFFGRETARQLAEQGRADLIVGNNILAHVPDLNDFVAGLAALLNPGGVITLEFPHLLTLMAQRQFDTIYHEHFSYFSFLAARRALAAHGLRVFDVERLGTHGGSLRVYACHLDDPRAEGERVRALGAEELEMGLEHLETYRGFAESVRAAKRDLLAFLIERKREGETIVGYGAPAKGNTLLNYCGIGTDFVEYTVDRNPHKQGRYLPGSHIPICPVDAVRETEPDLLFILPWNLKDEIMEQMSFVRGWGCRFLVTSPELVVYE